MNPYAVLQRGTFRNLITVFAPGVLASLPFFPIAYSYTPPEMRRMLDPGQSEGFSAYSIIAFGALL